MMSEKTAQKITHEGKIYKRYFMPMFLYTTFEEWYKCEEESTTQYIYFLDWKYMSLDKKEIIWVEAIE